MKLSKINAAWLAGLLEGEGYFFIRKKPSNKSFSPPGCGIRLAMTDEDVVKKVADLLGSSYFSPTRKTSKNKTVYIVTIEKKDLVLNILPQILPYMGKRRAEKINLMLSHLKEWKRWVKSGGRSKVAKYANSFSKRN